MVLSVDIPNTIAKYIVNIFSNFNLSTRESRRQLSMRSVYRTHRLLCVGCCALLNNRNHNKGKHMALEREKALERDALGDLPGLKAPGNFRWCKKLVQILGMVG